MRSELEQCQKQLNAQEEAATAAQAAAAAQTAQLAEKTARLEHLEGRRTSFLPRCQPMTCMHVLSASQT